MLNSLNLHVQSVAAIAACVMLQMPVVAQMPPSSPPTVTTQSSYALGPGDQIEITVAEYEEYTGPKVILPDGTITLPVIGAVMAAGQTPDQLARELTTRLKFALVDPIVTVSLNTLRPVLVNVAGEVQRPGPIQLRSLTTTTAINITNGARNPLDRVPNVSSALIEAGGITQNADIREVVIRRSLPGGESSTLKINLWDALWSDAAPQNLILQDGDSIFVPRLAADEKINRRLLARSSLAPSTIRVRVVGEVKNPGEVQVPPDSSLSSAVAIAGGPTIDAKLSQVGFIRLNEQGQVEKQTIDLRNLTDSYQVQEGDVVIVPKKGSSSFLDFAARVINPASFLLRLIGF